MMAAANAAEQEEADKAAVKRQRVEGGWVESNDAEAGYEAVADTAVDVVDDSEEESESLRRKLAAADADAQEFLLELEKLTKPPRFDDSVQDTVKFEEEGWKKRYYQEKFHVSEDDEEFRKMLCKDYITGVVWVFKYYYSGCPSWGWFYPHHYAPFASDLKGLSRLTIEFARDEPFTPLQQLLAVLPPRSAHALPAPLRAFMEDPRNEDMYPRVIQYDPNGKTQRHYWVCLLPFVDAKSLIAKTQHLMPQLTPEERARNALGCPYLIVNAVVATPQKALASEILAAPRLSLAQAADVSCFKRIESGPAYCIFGYISCCDDAPPVSADLVAAAKGQRTFENLCARGYFRLPDYVPHSHKLLPGAQECAKLLTQRDVQDIIGYIGRQETIFGASKGSVQEHFGRHAPPPSNLDVAQRLIRGGLVHQAPLCPPQHNHGPYAPPYHMPRGYPQQDYRPAAMHPLHAAPGHYPPYAQPQPYGHPSSSRGGAPTAYGAAPSHGYGGAHNGGSYDDRPPHGAAGAYGYGGGGYGSGGYGGGGYGGGGYDGGGYGGGGYGGGGYGAEQYAPAQHAYPDHSRAGYAPRQDAPPPVGLHAPGYGRPPYDAAPYASARPPHFDPHAGARQDPGRESEANRAAAAAFRNQAAR
jgi:5'-3' exoribonuclease 2